MEYMSHNILQWPNKGYHNRDPPKERPNLGREQEHLQGITAIQVNKD